MYQEYLAEVNAIPYFSKNALLFLLILGVLLIVTLLTNLFFFYVGEPLPFFGGIVVMAVFVLFISSISYDAKKVEVKNKYKDKAPVEWVIEKEQVLYSIDIHEKYSLNGSGNLFIRRLSSDNFTDYKYVIKTENGYQLQTLSKQFEFNEEDVFIKEESSEVTPKILFEQKKYKEKEFQNLFGKKGTRVTFVVPEGTVFTGFEPDSIK